MSILIKELITNLENFVYCFQIELASGEELNLTNSDHIIKNEEIIFLPNSGLDLKEAEFNDSAQNQVIIEGVFEEKGITAEMNLNNAVIKITIYNNGVFEHFITYYCTLYIKYDLNFKMYLKPETIKYNQTIINRYSKTCRVSFGDSKCKINKSLYSGVYKIKEILKESLRIEN